MEHFLKHELGLRERSFILLSYPLYTHICHITHSRNAKNTHIYKYEFRYFIYYQFCEKIFIRLIYILFNICTCNYTLTFAFVDYFMLDNDN